MSKEFQPKLVAFLCNWCSYAGADLAGTSRNKYSTNLKPIRVMCSSRVNPLFILKAFQDGADAVLVAGCHPHDCHYMEGNFYTRRRMLLLRRIMEHVGIDKKRLRLEWISASEGQKFANVVEKFNQEIKELGPLDLRKRLENE